MKHIYFGLYSAIICKALTQDLTNNFIPNYKTSQNWLKPTMSVYMYVHYNRRKTKVPGSESRQQGRNSRFASVLKYLQNMFSSLYLTVFLCLVHDSGMQEILSSENVNQNN